MEIIFKAREHLDQVWVLSEKCHVKATSENQFVSAMLYVGMNHADAIQVLAQGRNFASAFALMRPLLETSFRAMWLHRCASSEQIADCMDDKKWPSGWDAALAYEKYRGHNPVLSSMWKGLREKLHSFTHGGAENALRQLGDGDWVSPNFSDREIQHLLSITGLLSTLLLIEMVDLSCNEEVLEELETVCLSFLEWGGKQ